MQLIHINKNIYMNIKGTKGAEELKLKSSRFFISYENISILSERYILKAENNAEI